MELQDKGTFATMCSGGGLFDLGAQAAGLKTCWAVERNPDIAAVYRANHPTAHLLVGDVCDVDYESLPAPDWLHASPSCTNASRAKRAGSGVRETWVDKQTARAVCRALERLPRIFSLENVWGYRLFNAFQMITQQLSDLGYVWDFWHLNAADYGVPQARKRLILVARRDGVPPNRPEPTHCKGGDLLLPPWVSWYDALVDLIPTLPPSELAPWQVRLLRSHTLGMHRGVLIEGAGGGATSVFGYRPRHDNEPAPTITASAGRQAMRAVVRWGRVTVIPPRALARFQSIPDSYHLPDHRILACRIIGDAVPPLLARRIVEANAGGNRTEIAKKKNRT
jgi:DNA (cytosine-5)-methyltransferase 1